MYRCVIILVLLSGSLFSVFTSERKLGTYQSFLLELNPNARAQNVDTMVTQESKGRFQYDYSWPSGQIDLSRGSFFYLSEFQTAAFKNQKQGLLTLEFLQGVSLQAFDLTKGKPLATPWAENCVHHPMVNKTNKIVGYSFICLDKDNAFWVMSSYPLKVDWMRRLFNEN